jgi:integration host factor subunit alpha
MTLTKAEIVDYLQHALGFTRRDAKQFVESFFDELHDALVQGLDIKLSGFGNFYLRDKNSRPGRNPKTGEEVSISARRVVTFQAGEKLKDQIADIQ